MESSISISFITNKEKMKIQIILDEADSKKTKIDKIK